MEIKDIVEIAAFNYSGAFLFDQNLGSENKDMYEVLNQQDPQPVREAQLKRQGQVFEPTITKDQVINEVKNKLYKTPEENPHKIIEHEFKITEVSLIFIPFYDLNLKYRDKTKKVRLNAMTSKVAPLS
jgi:hypothetical protein